MQLDKESLGYIGVAMVTFSILSLIVFELSMPATTTFLGIYGIFLIHRSKLFWGTSVVPVDKVPISSNYKIEDDDKFKHPYVPEHKKIRID